MSKQEFIDTIREMQKTYGPSKTTKEALSQIDLVAIVGPTGVGKSAIIDKLGLPYVMSDVSRRQRANEKNDESYHFRTDYDEMMKEIKNGEYVQFVISKFDEFYGTRLSSYPTSGVCTMAIIADVIPVFRKLGFRSMRAICIMPPSYVEWMHRIGGVRTDELAGRIREARQSIIKVLDDKDYSFVLNDDLDLAIRDIYRIMNNEEIDEHRSGLARDTADSILARIGDN